MDVPPQGEDWIALTEAPLDTAAATAWAITPSCGAVVSFAGTVRDHSEHRTGVSELEYEAYAEQVEPRLSAIAAAARQRWAEIGRLVLVHRIGRLGLGEVSVFVAASTPHRPEAFSAARFLIDTIKVAVPIWKRETWEEGTDWSLCDHEIEDVSISETEREALLAEIDRVSERLRAQLPLDTGSGR